jgi:hypothetical protein
MYTGKHKAEGGPLGNWRVLHGEIVASYSKKVYYGLLNQYTLALPAMKDRTLLSKYTAPKSNFSLLRCSSRTSSGESGFGSNQIETNSLEKKHDHKTPSFQNSRNQ